MTPKNAVIKGAYFQDLLGQPQALQDTLDGLEVSAELRTLAAALAEGKFHRIVLTGMGASLHALHPLNLRLIDRGFNSLMADTSELIHYMPRLLDESTLVVVVSQSGKSAEIVRLIEMPERRSRILGITNTGDSPLARKSDAAILTRAGTESTVSCKTYVSALAALEWVGDVLCGNPNSSSSELRQGVSAVKEYLDRWELYISGLVAELEGVRDLFFAGRGSSLAAAYSAGLILKESTRYHSEGINSAALRHGPIEMMRDSVFVLVYAGDPRTTALNAALVNDVRGAGGRAFLCCSETEIKAFRIPRVGEAARPILEILPAQMISLALGALGGFEAGRFELATKITANE